MMNRLVILSLLAALGADAQLAGFGGKPPPPPKTTKVDNFPWRDPFSNVDILMPFDAACAAEATFPAKQYTLHNLMDKPPLGLRPYGGGLKKFFQGREYPGSWDGLDRHLHDRSLMMMEYADVPAMAKLWMEEQDRVDGPGKGLYAVFEKAKDDEDEVSDTVPVETAEVDRAADANKIVIFAPGALYHILPLWVAGGSSCQDDLVDLSRYVAEPVDGGVVAWPVDHTKPKNRIMEFTVKAQVLKQKPQEVQEGDKEGAKEELWTDKEKDEL